jgi:uncharacterized DUF497 family protein
MKISYDSAKHQQTLEARGLDFADAIHVFADTTIEIEDRRKNYGEQRIICFGYLATRLVVVFYVPRGSVRHIISMRKANAREKARIAPLLRF